MSTGLNGIAAFVAPPLGAVARGEAFSRSWTPGGEQRARHRALNNAREERTQDIDGIGEVSRWAGLLFSFRGQFGGPGSDGGQTVPGTAFRRYFTEDRFGRRISFFLSRPYAASGPLPVVVWVQGTGCSSLFGRAGDRITARAQALVHDAVRGRALVLAVDKPGVEFLDQQPDAADSRTCQPEFLREHTLDRWAEAIVASIKAVHAQAGVDLSRTLVIGASEGGIVAVKVSNVLPAVSHVASLAGGGPAHLFDLAEFMRRRRLDPEKEVYGCWKDIVRDPDSTTNFCWGHPYRQLSSFLNTSLIQECLRTNARLYLAHGTADEQNFIAGFDMMRAELAAKGREAVFDRVEGADHGFELPGQEAPRGLVSVLERILSWFLLSDEDAAGRGKAETAGRQRR